MQALRLEICGNMECVQHRATVCRASFWTPLFLVVARMRACWRGALAQLNHGITCGRSGGSDGVGCAAATQKRMVWRCIGKVYARMGLRRNAIDAFESALAFAAKRVEAQSMLAMRHYNIGGKSMDHAMWTAGIEKSMCGMWINYSRGDKKTLITAVNVEELFKYYEAQQ